MPDAPEPFDYATPIRQYPSLASSVVLFALAVSALVIAHALYRSITAPDPLTIP